MCAGFRLIHFMANQWLNNFEGLKNTFCFTVFVCEHLPTKNKFHTLILAIALCVFWIWKTVYKLTVLRLFKYEWNWIASSKMNSRKEMSLQHGPTVDSTRELWKAKWWKTALWWPHHFHFTQQEYNSWKVATVTTTAQLNDVCKMKANPTAIHV